MNDSSSSSSSTSGCSAYPELMRAVIQPGKTSSDLTVSDSVRVPHLQSREVLIKVHYAALNRMDLYQASGTPPPPGASEILGCEVSGIIVFVADDCKLDFQVGEPVMAIVTGGGYAEYCPSDERTVARVPAGIGMDIAAAIPEAFVTAYQLLFTVGGAKRGESVLMHAASSSIGQAAIQIAKCHGITVLSSTRTDSKCAKCIELGADHSFKLGNDGKFAEDLLAATNGKKVNVILDPVCGSYLADDIAVTDHDARIVVYGLMGGGGVHDASFLNKMLAKRVSMLFSTLRSRHPDYKADIIRSLSEGDCGFHAVATERIKVDVFAKFTLERVAEAHALMTSNGNTGKILLHVSN
jgi:tumor protein p53-inducible protein 3